MHCQQKYLHNTKINRTPHIKFPLGKPLFRKNGFTPDSNLCFSYPLLASWGHLCGVSAKGLQPFPFPTSPPDPLPHQGRKVALHSNKTNQSGRKDQGCALRCGCPTTARKTLEVTLKGPAAALPESSACHMAHGEGVPERNVHSSERWQTPKDGENGTGLAQVLWHISCRTTKPLQPNRGILADVAPFPETLALSVPAHSLHFFGVLSRKLSSRHPGGSPLRPLEALGRPGLRVERSPSPRPSPLSTFQGRAQEPPFLGEKPTTSGG